MGSNEHMRHALVVGAGFAGLLAARVLSEHFHRVTLVDRDRITDDTGHRSGIPQARHPHALMTRGAQVLEELFPGLREEISAQDAGCGDVGRDMKILLPGGWAPRTPVGITPQQIGRVTLERLIRRRVMSSPAVTLVDGVQIDGIVVDAAANQVTGVAGRHRSPSGHQPVRLTADLVIDASGRASRLADWLVEAGYPRPAELVVDGRLTYTSRLYSLPGSPARDWITSYQLTHAPDVRRGGVVARIDGGLWFVGLIGAGGEKAPVDEAGFREFASSLDNPDVAGFIEDAIPMSRVYRAPNLSNRLMGYHRMRRWPDRLVAIGDSVCSFNPVYGQGMTVAALQAVALGTALRRRAGLDGLARSFQRSVARSVRDPWTLASSTDLGWQQGKPGIVAGVGRWYLANFLAAIPASPDLFRRMIRVQHMIARPAALVHPKALLEVIGQAIHRISRSGPGR